MQRQVLEVFTKNKVQVGGLGYTRSAEGRREQVLLNSCLHAIILARLDPHAAATELRSLVSHQRDSGADHGMIPHNVIWHDGRPVRRTVTHPPMIAVAALEIWKQTRETKLLWELFGPISRFHEWFDRRRDLNGDGIVVALHPDETLTPTDQSYPEIPESLGLDSLLEKVDYEAILATYHHDALMLREAGLFYVKPVCLNALRLMDLDALASIAQLLGYESRARHLKERVKFIRRGVQHRMWDKAKKQFVHLSGSDEIPIARASVDHLLALTGGFASEQQAKLLVADLLSDRYWAAFGILKQSHSDQSSEPTVCPITCWLIWKGLRRYGFEIESWSLAYNLGAAVSASGLREYYDGATGSGLGALNASASGVVLNMLITEGLLDFPSQVGHAGH